MRCGYPRAALAAQALAGFAAASLKEDRFGILQLNQVGGCRQGCERCVDGWVLRGGREGPAVVGRAGGRLVWEQAMLAALV